MEENNQIILFSALDWGLGHTTRSIPLLTFFNENKYSLLIAVQPGSASEKILQRHFPQAIFLPLKGYCISYAKKKKFFALKIIFQIPKILNAIRREHRFVRKTVQAYPIGMILSDNRYGFYHKQIPSVFVTHQLRIAAPWNWLEQVIQYINYRYIRRFDELWIPDLEGHPNLGGGLSHPEKMPGIPVQYIGLLSRLSLLKNTPSPPGTGKPFKYLFLLSGPEPQRSILERKLLELAHQLPRRSVLVRGLPAEAEGAPVTPAAASSPGLTDNNNQLTVIPYADPMALNQLLKEAEYVVCRSGYSTVMDLILLGKKGIYIPTPGQTEQAYLAKRLADQHWGFSFDQDENDYLAQFQRVEAFTYTFPAFFTGLSIKIPKTAL